MLVAGWMQSAWHFEIKNKISCRIVLARSVFASLPLTLRAS
jgi:hypothetical protein